MEDEIICVTCGTQYPQIAAASAKCPICLDDRQYVPLGGQTWTSLQELRLKHGIIAKKLHSSLYQLKMIPTFAIGQRALLVLAPSGNILWDCISLMNEPVIEFIKARGGLKAIAFSHPHYFTTMNEWASVFDCPIFIHRSDEQWIFKSGGYVNLWQGTEKQLWDNIKLINIGGHFPGSSILHVPFLSAKGALLCGDTFYVSPSQKHVSAMYSYPNSIPLPLAEIHRIKQQIASLSFDSLYGFYDFQNIRGNAKQLMLSSLARYI